MLFNLHEFECVWVFSLRLVSSFGPLWSEKMLDVISIFLDLLRLVLHPIMWSIFKMFHVHLKRMCILLPWDERLYIYQISQFLKGLVQWHNIFVDILFGRAIFDSEVLKSPTIIVLLSISFLKSSKVFFMYLGAPLLGAYIFTMFMSSWWILPLSIMKWPSGSLFMALLWKSILSDMSIATPFLFLSVCLENWFPALHFQCV